MKRRDPLRCKLHRVEPHGGTGFPLCNQEIFWFVPAIQLSVIAFFPNITWPLGCISIVVAEPFVESASEPSDLDTFLLFIPVPIPLTPVKYN